MKQAIIIRTDLKLQKGKIAAQACHASLESYKKSSKDDIKQWESNGQKKIVLKVSTLDELLEIYKQAQMNNLSCSLITDAGLTQVEPGTKTCVGIGPASCEKIDELTGHLKLL